MNKPIDKAIKIAGSQAELARLSGITQAAISVLSNGRAGSSVTPRFETAKKLSKAVSHQIEWHEFMVVDNPKSSEPSDTLESESSPLNNSANELT